MKRVKIFLVVTLFLGFSATQALAIDLYGFGSYWDKGDLDGSVGVGVGVSFPIIVDALRVDGRVHYFEDSDYGRGNITVTPVDLGLQLHFMPDGPFDPYVLGGISYNYVDADEIDADSEFGGYLGAGADMILGSPALRLFGEVMYRYSDIDDVDEHNLDASGVSGAVGLKFHFF